MDPDALTFYVASAAATISAMPVAVNALRKAWSVARRIRVEVKILPPSL